MDNCGRENQKNNQSCTAEAHDLLLKYDDPGNVQELVNNMERAVGIARDEYITVNDIPFKSDDL